MFICEVYQTEGQAWDMATERETYYTTRGRGLNLRSAKKAMEAAKVAFRKASRENAIRYPYGGVPVLSGVVVFKDGKIIKETW